MLVTKAVREQVEAKLREGIALASAHYKRSLRFPTITYKLGGSIAGQADYRNWEVRFNPVLLMENLDTFLARTVPHELAHLVCHTVYPSCYDTNVVRTARGWKRTKRDVHGWYWKEIMRVIGAGEEATRCHQYDITNVARRKASFQYKCAGCGTILNVGPKIHKQLQRDPGSRWHRSCRRFRLELVNQKAPSSQLTKPVQPTPQQSPTAGLDTKKAQALALYRANKDKLFRLDIIELFMKQLNMTRAGATTYYHACQKALG